MGFEVEESRGLKCIDDGEGHGMLVGWGAFEERCKVDELEMDLIELGIRKYVIGATYRDHQVVLLHDCRCWMDFLG